MNDLIGKSTVKRRKAAQKLQKGLKDGATHLESISFLYQGLILEEGTKNWQTKVSLLRAIGIINSQDKNISEYIFNSYILTLFDSATARAAATAYVRLERKNKDDARIVLELLEFNNYNISEGVLEALGYDKMCPDVNTQNKIIEKCFSFKHKDKFFTDPRYGLAAACAGWTSEKVIFFLENCLKSEDMPLIYVAEKALKGKYVKLRTLG